MLQYCSQILHQNNWTEKAAYVDFYLFTKFDMEAFFEAYVLSS